MLWQCIARLDANALFKKLSTNNLGYLVREIVLATLYVFWDDACRRQEGIFHIWRSLRRCFEEHQVILFSKLLSFFETYFSPGTNLDDSIYIFTHSLNQFYFQQEWLSFLSTHFPSFPLTIWLGSQMTTSLWYHRQVEHRLIHDNNFSLLIWMILSQPIIWGLATLIIKSE